MFRPSFSGPARLGHVAGFTLVEILIVVVILGVLAGIVLPMINTATEDARKTAFVADVRIFASAAELFMNQRGQLLEDASSGVCPTGFDDYIDEGKWTSKTPIGGVWDAQQNEMGISSAIGVHFNAGNAPDDNYMGDIDNMLDDGELSTGGFRKIAADRFYWVVRY